MARHGAARGFDLAALNIQRGRDHGLADYNTVRVAYGLPRLTSFAQITPDTAVQAALQNAYGTVDKIDLWVGGLAEKHLPGSSVGQTFTAIMVDQFKRLQTGDRYWYQNVLPASAVSAGQRTTLADVIRRNTQLTNLQPDVFVLHTSIGGTVFADGNRDLVLNMFNWLSNDEELISIRPKDPEDRRLNMNVKQSTLLFYASVVVIPLLVVVAGVGVWWRRR